MTDIFDRATELEERDRELALQRHRARRPQVAPGSWRDESAKWCEGHACGARIPDARRRALPGVRLCVECAGREEQQSRTRR